MDRQRATNATADDILVEAARAGDPAAFDRLVQRHRPWVLGLLQSIVGDRDHAQDLAQEVFCRLHQRLDGYCPQGAFVPWLKRLAINLARNFLRDHRQQRRRTVAWQDAGAGQEPVAALAPRQACLDPQAVLASRLLCQEVRAALAALSKEQQQVVALHYFGGGSVEEIARTIGCPPGTVKSRLFHARRRLREALLPAWSSPTDNTDTIPERKALP